MTNLLRETKEAIKTSGHRVSDIVFIGSLETGHSCSWKKFARLADVDYDSGFGGAEVATDLRIVFSDGQTMWRGEYDGSEWWEFSKPAVLPDERRRIERLVGDLWPTLSSLNGEPKTPYR
jgi:hypothetical protein